ncbi:MAG TPA: tRNA lysidine(34) synthetase TilS [Actinomycetales bacterium]|nr:tRNA lysidine(34) synthetase TilS [Actinomycetales bacterium]
MAGPPAAVAAVRVAVREALTDLPSGALVLVACSGGADSLALAAATAFVAPRADLRAGAAVVDHGLQPGSNEVAVAAAAQCESLGLGPVRLERVLVAARGAGPEAEARTARLAALERLAAADGAVAVLLGHTLDDQAETVLLGLARGAGARSLAGMAAGRGVFRRPLLELDRTTVREACRLSGLDAWEDPSNADLGVARARVRGNVLPTMEAGLGPGVAAALARTASMLRDDADLLDHLAGELMTAARLPSSDPVDVVLDVAVLAAAAPALRRRVLRTAALEAGSPAAALSRAHVLAVDALVTAWHGQGPLHLPAVTASRRGAHLTLAHQPPRHSPKPS